MRNNFMLTCLALVLFLLSACNSGPNTNNNASPSPTAKPSVTAVATPTPECTVKQTLAQVWCEKSGCKKDCYLYEDGKKIRKSSGPKEAYNRREVSKYQCKCE